VAVLLNNCHPSSCRLSFRLQDVFFCGFVACTISSGGDEVNYYLLQFVIELTNAMQTISFSSNYVVYALLNVKFRHALQDVLCCCLLPAAELTPPRGQPLVEMERGNISRWRRHSTYVNRQRPHTEFKTTVHHTTSV